MENKYVISLEIGSSAVRVSASTFAAQPGASQPRGPLTLFAEREEPLYNSVRYGRIQNVEEVATQTMAAVRSLAMAPELGGRRITGAYVAIGGRSLHTVRKAVELPLPGEVEITQEHINHLQREAEATVDPRLEVLDTIPLSYTVDNIGTARPVGTFGHRISAEYNIVVCNPANSRNLERVVCDRCKLDICGFVVRPLAIADLVLSNEDTKPGCMLVDVGAETVTVSIYKDSVLQYLSTIPLGSQHITRDLATGLGIVDEQAESLKIRLGNAIEASTTQSPEQREIDNYVQARVVEIIANIVAQIEFAGYSNDSLRAGIILTGRGAKLKNFGKLLEVQSHMTVRMATVPTVMRVSADVGEVADLLPIMAVSSEGAVLSLAPQAVPCVEAPARVTPPAKPVEKPVAPKPVEKPAPPTEKKTVLRIDDDTPQTADSTFNQGYDDDAFGTAQQPADKKTYTAGKNRHRDDDTLLLDDDEAARRRAESMAKAQEQQRRAEEKRRREEKRRQREEEAAARPPQPSLWQRVKDRVERLVNNIDDGADLTDD